MTRQRYLLDTCICAYWLRDKKMELVTENVKDFLNIKDIKIENWVKDCK